MPKSNGQRHVLIFEPRVEGHHIPYLVNIANELLSLGNTVSIAIDNRTEEAKKRILQQDSTLLAKLPFSICLPRKADLKEVQNSRREPFA